MIIFHGSPKEREKPEYGKGKPYNDYGLGFYCTENIEIAKEWSCSDGYDGFANKYALDIKGLKILNLNTPNYSILHWLTLLLKNRTFRLTNSIAKAAKQYLLEHFIIETTQYDIIIGYRADDSYFTFAEDFLNNAISINKLKEAMYLGNLGEQVVLVSQKAFNSLKFIKAEKADGTKYYVQKIKRDKAAREKYLNSDRNPSYELDELYMIDIMRQGVKPDDPRLR